MTSRSVQKRYIECPFCSGVLEPKMGKMRCPECRARFEWFSAESPRWSEKMESIFVDIEI